MSALIYKKRWITLLALLVVFIGMGFAVVTQKQSRVAHTLIHIDNHNGMSWLNDSDVIRLLQDKNLLPGTQTTHDEIMPDAMERALQQNPYVHKADVYIDANNNVHIALVPNEAIVRVINMRGVSFYLSTTGQKLPLSANFTARVTVATGSILNNGPGDEVNDTALMHTLFFVAKKIYADTFLHALTEQLVVDENDEWTLIPKWGKAHIIFGDTQNWDDKTERLKAFYANADKNIHWQHYTQINLKYLNQVVCTRDDVMPAPVVQSPTADATTKVPDVNKGTALPANTTADVHTTTDKTKKGNTTDSIPNVKKVTGTAKSTSLLKKILHTKSTGKTPSSTKRKQTTSTDKKITKHKTNTNE